MNKRKKLIEIESRGVSMLPLIRAKDKIHIEIIKPNQQLHLGDVVVFPFHGQLLCHRIVWINKNAVITKGDNTWRGEMVKPLKNIIGRVILVKRRRQIFDFQNRNIQLLNFLLFCFSFTTFLIAEAVYFMKRVVFWLKNIILSVEKSA